MCWWAFTGLTHIILEGYFAFTPDFYKVNSPHYLAEVCKFLALLYFCVSSFVELKQKTILLQPVEFNFGISSDLLVLCSWILYI